MSWLTNMMSSSIGKKFLMGLTGLFLCSFLVVHLTGNLLLLKNDGGVAFNQYSEFMSSSGNIPIRIMEVGLFLFFILHIVSGIKLWIENKKARPVKYAMNNPANNSSVFSRSMFVSASVVFIFLIVHLNTFFVDHRIFGDGVKKEIEIINHATQETEKLLFSTASGLTMAESVMKAFENPFYSLFYVLAMILLGYHLNHGFQSAFQTFGINNKKYTPVIKGLGMGFAILMSVGYSVIPIFFFLKSYLGGN